MGFAEDFKNKVTSGTASLDDVREYVADVGINLAHLSDGYGQVFFNQAETMAFEKQSDKLTNTSVGGALLLIYWMVKEASESADTARMGRTRSLAEETHKYAKSLIDLADAEMQKIFPGTDGNLLEERNKVYMPLPDNGWMF